MTMPQRAWYGAAAGYLGMWMAVMVPMMLPSLIPMLSRYRRAARGAEGARQHGLTALVAAGYFLVWAILGVIAYATGAGVMAAEMR
jgi:predicted metal-binding membrane protein